MEGLTADGKARLTLILACSGSLLAGGVGGYLAARAQGKRDFEKRVDTEVSAEVEEVKRYYRERLALQTAEAERRGVAQAAAAMAVPGPGDNPDERPTPVGPANSLGQDREGHTPYHRPSSMLTALEDALPDDADADEDPDGGNPPNGLSGTGDGSSDSDFWPAEELADTGPEPDVPPVEGGLDPFIITRTEYYADYDDENPGNQKVGITYYEGDGILADDKDVPIRDSAAVVGTDYVAGFGSADDPDIVYVRNNRLRIDFEIVRSLEGYAQHVLSYGKPQ